VKPKFSDDTIHICIHIHHPSAAAGGCIELRVPRYIQFLEEGIEADPKLHTIYISVEISNQATCPMGLLQLSPVIFPHEMAMDGSFSPAII
jgi:hypothetical protein